MTFFIGGSYNRTRVSSDKLDEKEIIDFGEKINTMSQSRKVYKQTKISLHGTIKTFYIIEGQEPIDHRDLILELWGSTPTDVYAI